MSVNKVILVGRLGVDPELKSLDGGQSVCNMSIATSESWKDKEGNKQEKTEWHRCTAWGKTAELCGQYLKKGREVYIEGKLQTRKYEKDGVEKYATDIVVSTVQFLGGKNDATSPAPASSPEQDAGPVNEEMGF